MQYPSQATDISSHYYDAFAYPQFTGPDESLKGLSRSPFSSPSSFDDASQYSYGGFPTGYAQQGPDAAPPGARRLHFVSNNERNSRNDGRDYQRRRHDIDGVGDRRHHRHHHDHGSHRRHEDEEHPRNRRRY
jgi:hypothetical protein